MSNNAVVIALPLNQTGHTHESTKPIATSVTMSVESTNKNASLATPELPKQPNWLASNWQAYTAAIVLPLITFSIVIGLWFIVQKHFATDLPTPIDVWNRAIEVFANPFYDAGPNDKGIGWQVLYSLGRVMAGFSLAVLIGIPVGFLMGMSANFSRACTPLIQILRPVSPLAWLPIGLLMFKAVDPSAIFVIFITSIWPIIINTSAGVRAIPKDYMNVAAVLQLNTFEITHKILLPSTLPHILTGMRLSLNIAWMVIVAAEMLTGGIGIGFYVWDEWNNLNVSSIVVAILLIGFVGILLETIMNFIQSRFDYNAR
ncbi:nitrate ABC transporter permease [Beggiatoa leptomitoformis]|uniref:Nitrate ABC transporter permease n=1 Tax=Beggiatoa leptomitoformis TaxID=288004 RepID=A0A2N9YHM4_9GAMM|nr:nitrate ABC transporter permease [Beggiatoa leptomitoformis]ALG67771.1 nitrate ABC transporter permease [Beggiatoa leptomitoformis]AUI69984.1 nitrate ABC transporter permease [Beggiatoa leptomitoformis]